ncbi:hypothetical protein [uncultured Roseobacter sp.]|uniref:hypothetical protein n=1 Tax=uncultured Roseobacter sp. TaxID=114847 RepID=UPI00260B18A6|nr:hypothetical protein [uncultured Roseobacter sp.]
MNPRQEVAQEAVEALAESVKTCGLLQNLRGLQDESGKIGIAAVLDGRLTVSYHKIAT